MFDSKVEESLSEEISAARTKALRSRKDYDIVLIVFQVKVKLCLGALYGDLVAELPFVLMHPKPEEEEATTPIATEFVDPALNKKNSSGSGPGSEVSFTSSMPLSRGEAWSVVESLKFLPLNHMNLRRVLPSTNGIPPEAFCRDGRGRDIFVAIPLSLSFQFLSPNDF